MDEDVSGHQVRYAGRELTVSGRRFELSPLEFAVMAALSARPGQTVSRDELLEHAWDGRRRSSNVVDAIILCLRRKLGASSGQIETIRGVGYRYRPERGV